MEQLQQNNNWDLDKLESNDLSCTVEIIYLCALRNDFNEGDEAGEPPTNQWTMCLQHTVTSCVKLDMAPGYGTDGLRGKIELTSIGGKPFTEESLRVFSYKARRQVTISNVMRMISEKGRYQFNFSPEWEGCRFWMSVVMKDFEDDALVEAGSSTTAMDALRCYWINPPGSEPRVMREGIFRGTK